MRPHPPEDELHGWLDGQLSTAQGAEIAEHLLDCLICRVLAEEVRISRDRTSAILGLMTLPVRERVRPRRSGWHVVPLKPAAAAAAAVALLVAGSGWAGNRSSSGPHAGSPASQSDLASAASPAIFAAIKSPTTAATTGLDSSGVVLSSQLRRLRYSLATRDISPRIITPRAGSASVADRPLEPMDPLMTISPSMSQAPWQNISFRSARDRSGPLSYIRGLAVSVVRVQANSLGGRATAMVRQLLPDGRAVWVIEGAEADVVDVAQLLKASGLTLARPRRTTPDYLGPNVAPVRTIRVATIAAYLPLDSLEVLGRRLRSD